MINSSRSIARSSCVVPGGVVSMSPLATTGGDGGGGGRGAGIVSNLNDDRSTVVSLRAVAPRALSSACWMTTLQPNVKAHSATSRDVVENRTGEASALIWNASYARIAPDRA